jgi:hypothetical protein
MSGTGVMRGLALAIAIAAAIDPPVRMARSAPLPVALRTPSGLLVPAGESSSVPAEARAVRALLAAELPGTLAINTLVDPRALIVAGSTAGAPLITGSGPISFVSRPIESGARVQVLSVSNPRPVLPGWAAVVTADVAGHGLTPGASSAIVLESHGVEIDRVVHRWSRSEERVTVPLAFAPPAAGSFVLGVRAVPVEGRIATAPEAVPARVVADSRQLRILAFDPRPSWGSGFARRVLEEDPDFDVVTRVRASRGLAVRTGAAPVTLSRAAMDPFDLVLVGAPEELTTSEIAALESFADRRGGTVVLMADRKPSGPYTRLFGASAFEEALLEKPVRITASDGTGLRGSEFAYPAALPVGAEAIVTIPQGRGSRAVVVSMPFGAGRIVFSGVLDAWRYRGDDDEAFGSFWRSQLGREAARAPRHLEMTLDPGVATAGSRVRLRAVVRPTDYDVSGNVVTIPAVSARAVDDRGREEPVRMWPTAQAGVFEGWFDTARAGRYDVRVETDAGASVDSPFVVTAGGAREDPATDEGQLRAIAHATGGVAVTSTDIRPLVDHLRALPRDTMMEARHPMRSSWWAVVFVGLLSAEWAARRRRGLR